MGLIQSIHLIKLDTSALSTFKSTHLDHFPYNLSKQIHKPSEMKRQKTDVFIQAACQYCQLPLSQLAAYPCSPASQPAHTSLKLAHGSGKARIILTRWTPQANVSFGYSVNAKFPGILVRRAFNSFENTAINWREQIHWPILISLNL